MEDYTQKSYWLGATPYAENPPLRGEEKADVVIVGGGFTGVSTAYFLKKADPGLKVVLLESEVIGFGASGRNGGFNMTLFGFTLGITAFRFGRDKAREAHHYMEKAVDLVRDLVKEHRIECDYEHPGFLRVATSLRFEKRIRHEIDLARSLGLTGIEWIDRTKTLDQVNSPLYRGAWWEPRCGIVNPAKLVRGMKNVVEGMGVKVYERTPVTEITRDTGMQVTTPEGSVRADKLVLATNAYSHLIPRIRRKQVPVFTHIVLTEPLQKRHFDDIRWQGRQGIEDARDLVHYYRLTKDNRLLMGGRDVSLAFGRNMHKDINEKTFRELEEDTVKTFPVLKGIRFTHRWGGPVSVTTDFAPALGYLGDKRTAYSVGCVGHGVSLTHMNGWTLADLVREKDTDRTRMFFVNRKVLPWPPEPFRFVIGKVIKGYMRLEDMALDSSYH